MSDTKHTFNPPYKIVSNPKDWGHATVLFNGSGEDVLNTRIAADEDDLKFFSSLLERNQQLEQENRALKMNEEETNELLIEFRELLSNKEVLPIRSGLRYKLDKLIAKQK